MRFFHGEYPHYAYGPQASGYRTGDLSDVTPLGVMVPPLGIMQAFGDHASPSPRGGMAWSPSPRGSRAPERPEHSEIAWSTVALFGILAGGALAVYLIYKGTKMAVPISEKVGEATTRLLAARYGGGSPAAVRTTASARRTVLPPEPKKLPPPRSARPYTIQVLPEYEAYR